MKKYIIIILLLLVIGVIVVRKIFVFEKFDLPSGTSFKSYCGKEGGKCYNTRKYYSTGVFGGPFYEQICHFANISRINWKKVGNVDSCQ